MQAFGSIASLETAYYTATGKQLLLSEQQLMDCAWNSDEKHCAPFPAHATVSGFKQCSTYTRGLSSV